MFLCEVETRFKFFFDLYLFELKEQLIWLSLDRPTQTYLSAVAPHCTWSWIAPSSSIKSMGSTAFTDGFVMIISWSLTSSHGRTVCQVKIMEMCTAY